ncbi:MAG: glycosyltransferase family 4 protein [Candidatus Bathyarchaeota archaeon]|nr:glycosyltransferase family 4 protein [Candidatus Bathyarchaeota archaeon]MDH5787237.1 glycosyltransferase family 4 protein [Candidatus Bathyarchaeota archaeon]
MRIGFFVWEYPPALVGGLGTYAEYITREFVSMGNDVTVFTLNPGNLKTREIIKGVEVHRPLIADASNVFPMFVIDDLKKWGTNIRLFNDIFIYNILSATKFINSMLKKEGCKFDVVCVHDWLSGIAGIMVKNETKVPVTFHVHSTEWGRSGGQGSEVVSHLEWATAQTADKIITVSHAMQEDLMRHGWPKSKISVVWNGVDPERYSPKNCKSEEVETIRNKYDIKPDDNMILFLGRLTWVKGVTNLVQAMPMVLEEYPKTKLVILGKGEQQNDIIETANRLGISSKVACRFEFVPEKERILHYAAADVCIFPSTYEPFGIVSLEAMSMEKPLIVGAQGVVGFREQVVPSGPDQNGVHVNGGNSADIAWGIKEILRDKDRAKKLGENGRKRVLQYFTWRQAAEQTLQIYETLQHPPEKEEYRVVDLIEKVART